MGCEKCWSDAGTREMLLGGNKADHYRDLMKERADNPCTPEEQCGEMHVVLGWKDGTRHCVCGKVREEAGE